MCAPTSPYDSTASHRATAACSPGKKLVGVGGLIDSNGSGQDVLALTAVRPTPDLTSVTAAANETPIGYAGSWRATAVAVCANPIPGLAWADTNTAIDSTSTKRAPAACPTGTRVLSGGFDIGFHRRQRGTHHRVPRPRPHRRPHPPGLRGTGRRKRHRVHRILEDRKLRDLRSLSPPESLSNPARRRRTLHIPSGDTPLRRPGLAGCKRRQ